MRYFLDSKELGRRKRLSWGGQRFLCWLMPYSLVVYFLCRIRGGLWSRRSCWVLERMRKVRCILRLMCFKEVWMVLGRLLVCPFRHIHSFSWDNEWHGTAWWVRRALSNDPLVLSIYSVIYKIYDPVTGFNLDNRGTPHLAMYASYWGLLSGFIVCELVVL